MANQNYRGKRRNKDQNKKGRPNFDKGGADIPKTGATDAEDSQSKPGNDISWYTRYPNLTAAAGSFPFPNRPGMVLDLGTCDVSASGGTITYKTGSMIPGVMALEWAPSIGLSQYPTDPASILGKEIYSRVRKAYSGTLRADAPDYVVYLLALDSLFSYIAWLKRLYRTLNVWSPNNYVVPDGLLHAMGLCDPDILSLRSKKVELWQLINQLVLQSRKFTCPGSIDIINRHYWMNDNVYTDAPSINSQFYMFNQEIYLQYELGKFNGGSDNVGGLRAKNMPWYRSTTVSKSNALTPMDLYNVGIQMLDALIAWDDSYTINGYLQRAFEGEPMFMVDELPLDTILEPIFSPEVLSQIENSVCAPYGYLTKDVTGFDIWQDPSNNAIMSIPRIVVSITNDVYNETGFVGGAKVLINQRMDNPTALDNVIATRLKSMAYDVSATSGDNPVTTIKVRCATEVPLCWRMVGFTASGNVYDNTIYAGNNSTSGLVESEAVPSYIYFKMWNNTTQVAIYKKILRLGQFDWHPIILMGSNIGWSGSNEANDIAVIGDIHNPTTISVDELGNLHRVCVYSEFNSFGIS